MKTQRLVALYLSMILLIFVLSGFAAGAEQKIIHKPVPNKESGTDVYLGPRVQHVREYRSMATSAGRKAREEAAIRLKNAQQEREMNNKIDKGGGK
ncbi:MAG: hypothetical protein US57_C0003G0057 [Candidatus Moranbacteria bacterium GW2011_GWC2_37_73]|nr:MAG: hypothetical protein UR95_C0003G0002 [Parcubacteria group bacterium GW2011_GWC1_36_108]KKP99307.1 MAG: hypothetical protein US09_C0030G0008 [Candidatus Moranbacteria bacterium GW2011_GWD1_36_198]KKQ00754.1 MAG: hypothetical protein US10_C0026G0009 [Candidatus Moranbacteria bacterium GW2011_GWD2_36_198]KKQ40249.1 MAG: hypothetical protein US57_C0003G0057 [Candidatus Moranbacteria bacterium GW2011_GWC2_37_73]